jgi:hypothetical protein
MKLNLRPLILLFAKKSKMLLRSSMTRFPGLFNKP